MYIDAAYLIKVAIIIVIFCLRNRTAILAIQTENSHKNVWVVRRNASNIFTRKKSNNKISLLW